MCNTFAAKAQYKNDNILYKTVDPLSLYQALKNTKGYILLDVRSKGEYEDTSQFSGANIGRLKGALNINVRELGQRLNEIKEDKDKPVFVYCSHSQRSRRASKMLADSGFTNVTNVNGGLTSLLYFSEVNKKYFRDLYETKTNYAFISPKELCDAVNKNPSAVFLLDVRSDSFYRHIAPESKENALGNLKGSVNIPYNEIEKTLAKIPKNKQVILIDLYGDDAAKTADILLKNNYKDVKILIEGMDRWITMNEEDVPCKKSLYQQASKFSIISPAAFGKMGSNENVITVDVRSPEEFNNQHKDSWRNIGKIKNAIPIPFKEMESNISKLDADKNKPIIVYSFGGNGDAFTAAKYLCDNGFTNVNVLAGGLFNLRWTAANIKGQSYLKDFVTDIPDINK